LPKKHEELDSLSIDCHALIAIVRALAAQQCLQQQHPEMALRVLFERVNLILDDLEPKLKSAAIRDYHEAVRAALATFFVRIEDEIKRTI
jgi:hypothetical protein